MCSTTSHRTICETENMNMQHSSRQIEISKKTQIDNNFFEIKLIYENEPVKLRRLEIISDDEKIQMGFFDHKFEIFPNSFNTNPKTKWNFSLPPPSSPAPLPSPSLANAASTGPAAKGQGHFPASYALRFLDRPAKQGRRCRHRVEGGAPASPPATSTLARR